MIIYLVIDTFNVLRNGMGRNEVFAISDHMSGAMARVSTMVRYVCFCFIARYDLRIAGNASKMCAVTHHKTTQE